MTISLEEHVARAIRGDLYVSQGVDRAGRRKWYVRSAALEGYEDAFEPLSGSFETAREAEHEIRLMNARAAIAAVREREGAMGKARPGVHCWGYGCMLDETCVEYPRCSIRESERATCEAIARTKVKKLESPKGRRGSPAWFVARSIADQIAARKGNGEGK